MPTVSELGQRVKAKYPGAYNDLPDDELGRRIKAKFPGSYEDFSDSGFAAAAPAATSVADPFASAAIRRRALGVLPYAGGLTGGLAGGALGGLFFGAPGLPAAIEGAAYGGAIGEKMRRTLSGEPQSATATLGAAGEQAALEAGGGLLAKGVSALARPIMRGALGIGRTLPGEVPNALEEAISARAGVAPKPIARLGMATQQSAANLEDLLRASGRRFPARDITSEVRTLLNSRAMPNDQKAQIASKLQGFLRQHGTSIDAPGLKEIKQYYQEEANRAYQTASGPLSPYTKFAEAIAKGAQIQLEKIKGVAELEAQTQGLGAAENAVTTAYKRPGQSFELNKPGTWPVPYLTGPRFRSSVAMQLTNPRIKAALRQTPRVIVALLRQAAQADQTSVSP